MDCGSIRSPWHLGSGGGGRASSSQNQAPASPGAGNGIWGGTAIAATQAAHGSTPIAGTIGQVFCGRV